MLKRFVLTGMVAGAHVKIVYPDTGLSRETTTSSSGVFRLGGLPIGACHVEVGATGFEPLKTRTFALNVGGSSCMPCS